MSYPAFEHYKESGWSWIGAVPSHWDVRRMKTLFSRTTRPVEKGDKIVTAFRDGQVTLRENRREEGFTNALQEIGYQGVRRGDLVIHAMDGFAGAIGVSDSDGKSTPVYTVCVAKPDANARYYAALLRHMALSGFVSSLAKGIRERSTDFRWADASVLALPHPPLDEQAAIVAFLDRETGKIDALVQAQTRLIELLKEKRQAVISHAVTKGLDPAAPMKDSGIEWLGQVPAHWEVRPVGSLLVEPPCYGVLVPDFELGGVPMLRITDMEDGTARRDQLNTISPALSNQYSRTLMEVGDLALSVVGTIGESLIINNELAGVNLSRAIARLRTGPFCDVRFLRWAFRSSFFEHFVDLTCVGTAQRVLNMGDLSSLRVCLPPPHEQAAIDQHLTIAVDRFEALIRAAEATMTILQERRAALISAAVTGKIDVRGLAPQQAEAA